MTDALLKAGVARCRRAGLPITRPDDGGQPPAIAHPRADESADATGRGSSLSALRAGGRSIAVEPIREPSPTLVLSRLWNAHQHGRAALFVVPDSETAARIERLLASPVGVRTGDDGRRCFYAGPDRVRLEEGGYAAAPAGTSLQWRESITAHAVDGVRAGAVEQSDPERTPHAATDDADRSPSDPWLELVADGVVLARLDGVDALDCPSREHFPYAYARDRDKQIRVVDFAGRPVERYPGIGAMRDGGFQPVPAPLVPEHMFDATVDDWWTVTVADADA